MVGRRGGILAEAESSKGDGGIKVCRSLSTFPLVEAKRLMSVLRSKLTASAAHLRGLIHMHLKATDLAKEAFMEALARDVKCFESFEMLVGSEMMSCEEGTLLVSPVSIATRT